jgi:hypothetical protein
MTRRAQDLMSSCLPDGMKEIYRTSAQGVQGQASLHARMRNNRQMEAMMPQNPISKSTIESLPPWHESPRTCAVRRKKAPGG